MSAMYEDIKKQFSDLEARLMDPAIATDPAKMASLGKKHANLKDLMANILELEKNEKIIIQSQELINIEKDPEMKAMAQTELAEAEMKVAVLKKQIDEELHPADPNDKKDVIIEIRAGAGGDESALFAAELFRMYSRFAERHHWQVEIFESSLTGIGGFKEIVFGVKGKNAYGNLKFEGGTHRVQRVPETEKQGRVHTSTATVAVVPEAEDVDLVIDAKDLRIDTYCSSGPGGQKVNKTSSAIRITHLPTNVVVQCQDEKSQHQNKDKAMMILRSRLLQKMEDEKRAKDDAARKKQIGTGDRSEKIRTYNFPQDRITDHRIKQSWSNITVTMENNLEDIVQALKEAEKNLNKGGELK
ncbi:MAG: peptide chain release factor 1 [Patescibacteria group bacterium]|nr:peptide chain release factor 1 [Patescibacteria group bacterium]